MNDILYFSGVDRYNGLQLWQIDNSGYTKQVPGTFGSFSATLIGIDSSLINESDFTTV